MAVLRFAGFHLEGFGIFSGTTLPLPPQARLVVVEGPNEAGKSTLLAFIRSVLFGFPDRRSAENRYEPLRGGRYGGWIDLCTGDGRLYRVQRMAATSPAGRQGARAAGLLTLTALGSVAAGGGAGGRGAGAESPDAPSGAAVAGGGAPGLPPEFLGQLLGPVSATVYRNIFAFGLDELEQLATLTGEEVSARIYGAGLGLAAPLDEVDGQLVETAQQLFKAGRPAHAPQMNQVLRRLEERERRIAELSNLPSRYNDLCRRRQELAEALQQSKESVRELRQAAQQAQTLLQAWPLWAELQAGEGQWQELCAIPGLEGFPLDGVARLERLQAQMQDARQQLEGRQAEEARLRQQIQESQESLSRTGWTLPHAAAILRLYESRSLYSDRLQAQAKLEQDHAHLEEEIRSLLDGLGPGWDRERLAAVDVSLPARERLTQAERRLADAVRQEELAAAALQSQERVLDQRRQELQDSARSVQDATLRCRAAEAALGLAPPPNPEGMGAPVHPDPSYPPPARPPLEQAHVQQRQTQASVQRAQAYAQQSGQRLERAGAALSVLRQSLAQWVDARSRLALLRDQAEALAAAAAAGPAADRPPSFRRERVRMAAASAAALLLFALTLWAGLWDLGHPRDGRSLAYFLFLVAAGPAVLAVLAFSVWRGQTRQWREWEQAAQARAQAQAEKLEQARSGVQRLQEQMRQLESQASAALQSAGLPERPLAELAAGILDQMTQQAAAWQREHLFLVACLRDWNLRQAAWQHALQQREDARQALAEAGVRLQQARVQWEALLHQLSLPPGLAPETAKEFLSQAERGQRLLRERKAVQARREDLRAQLLAYEEELQAIAAGASAGPSASASAGANAGASACAAVPPVAEALAAGNPAAGAPATPAPAPAGQGVLDLVIHLKNLLDQAQRTRSSLQDLKERLAAAASQISQLQQALQEAAGEWERLYAAANLPAGDEEAFRRRAAQFARWQELSQRRRQLLENLSTLGLEPRALQAQMPPGTSRASLEAAAQEARNRLAAAEAELDRLQAEWGRLQGELESLEHSDELARLHLEQAQDRERLAVLARRWAACVLAHEFLARTRVLYERERQPAVLQRASRYFSALTHGGYVQVYLPLGHPKSRLQVLRQGGGAPLDISALSRGTAEQLYFAVRLAYAEEFAASAVALPLIMDDPFVNFDPGRLQAAARLLAGVADRHQILYFTCHPHVAEALRQAGRDARTAVWTVALAENGTVARAESPAWTQKEESE
ncbi:MAG: AAA family ATPase [Firmicutes bacterium]|nr:AAA family ATPase [Bacillota bacterium]